MSDSGILALPVGERGGSLIGQFLDSAQGAECQSLHFVLGLHQLPGYLAFDVRPDLFIRILMGRVRRQVEQFEFAVLGLDKRLDQLRLVDRITIDDQENRLLGADQQALEEFPEDFHV